MCPWLCGEAGYPLGGLRSPLYSAAFAARAVPPAGILTGRLAAGLLAHVSGVLAERWAEGLGDYARLAGKEHHVLVPSGMKVAIL